MEEQKQYQLRCVKCKKKTNHLINSIRITKGARLRCLNCKNITFHYKFDRLEELYEKQNHK